jgi:hypothetical protein
VNQNGVGFLVEAFIRFCGTLETWYAVPTFVMSQKGTKIAMIFVF